MDESVGKFCCSLRPMFMVLQQASETSLNIFSHKYVVFRPPGFSTAPLHVATVI